MSNRQAGIDKKTDRLSLLQAMGVRVWVERESEAPDQTVVPTTPVAKVAVKRPPSSSKSSTDTVVQMQPPTPASEPAGSEWGVLEATVSRCQACDLHRGRTQTVFGTGDRNARWMIIGEAPGAEEDRQGEPFVGRAGHLLNSMLLAAGFKRREVYIANIVKCRPPDNRDPRPEEAASCSGYLDRQIALVKPQIILAVGRVAAQQLLNSDTPVGRLRGKLHHYGSNPAVPVVVTYHPAYLLRAPKEKRKVWQDLLFALEQSETDT